MSYDKLTMLSTVTKSVKLPYNSKFPPTVSNSNYQTSRSVGLCQVLDYSSTRFNYTLCLKKVPTFKLSVTVSNLNRFSKILHCWQAYEICYKPLQQYPSHLKHVTTLPWDIKNSNFLQLFSRYGKCKQIAFLSLL